MAPLPSEDITPFMEEQIKAPSTRIRIFLNPQRFLSGYENIRVHTLCDHSVFISNSPVHTYSDSLRIHSSIQDNSVNIGYGACAAALSNRGNMSKSGKKANKNEGNKPESFIWSDDEVELLLNVTIEYRRACRC